MQIPSYPYLLILAVAIGLLAACGAPEPAEPADPTAPESAQLDSPSMVTGQAAAQIVSFESDR